MEGGVERPKPPPRPQRETVPEVQQDRVIVGDYAGPSGTHRNVVIGVTLLTLLVLFATFFWLAIWIAGVLNPSEAGWSIDNGVEIVTLDDYLTFGRVAFAVVAGAILTALTWMVADNLID
jgi:hypothetical protein